MLPRWRLAGSVLVAPDDPRKHGDFVADVSAADAMTAMRAAASEMERTRPDLRGRPMLFTQVVRA
jgi:hypothetical protein